MTIHTAQLLWVYVLLTTNHLVETCVVCTINLYIHGIHILHIHMYTIITHRYTHIHTLYSILYYIY